MWELGIASYECDNKMHLPDQVKNATLQQIFYGPLQQRLLYTSMAPMRTVWCQGGLTPKKIKSNAGA
jgi:hypothetical protein